MTEIDSAARLRDWIEAHTHEPTSQALYDLRTLKQSLDTYGAALSGTQQVRDDYKARAEQAQRERDAIGLAHIDTMTKHHRDLIALRDAEARVAALADALRLAIETAQIATEAHNEFMEQQTEGRARALHDAMEAVSILAALSVDVAGAERVVPAETRRPGGPEAGSRPAPPGGTELAARAESLPSTESGLPAL